MVLYFCETYLIVVNPKVCGADVDNLLTPVDYLVWKVTKRYCWNTQASIGRYRWRREVGRVTGNVTSGARPRSAKKVTDIYIFSFWQMIKFLVIAGKTRSFSPGYIYIYNDQQDPSIHIFKIGILYVNLFYTLDDDWPDSAT